MTPLCWTAKLQLLPYDADVDAVYRRAALAGVTDSLFTQMSGLQIPPLPPKTPIRLESRFSDLQATLWAESSTMLCWG